MDVNELHLLYYGSLNIGLVVSGFDVAVVILLHTCAENELETLKSC